MTERFSKWNSILNEYLGIQAVLNLLVFFGPNYVRFKYFYGSQHFIFNQRIWKVHRNLANFNALSQIINGQIYFREVNINDPGKKRNAILFGVYHLVLFIGFMLFGYAGFIHVYDHFYTEEYTTNLLSTFYDEQHNGVYADYMQSTFECCGVIDASSEYENTTIPDSCCQESVIGCSIKKAYKISCSEAIKSKATPMILIFNFAAIASSLLELVPIMLSLYTIFFQKSSAGNSMVDNSVVNNSDEDNSGEDNYSRIATVVEVNLKKNHKKKSKKS